MILTIILALIILVLGFFAFAACVAGGATMILIFGDVFVCIGFLVLLIRWIIKRRHK